jgi:hypothetical protein
MKRYLRPDSAVVRVVLPVSILYVIIIAVFYPGRISRMELMGEMPQGATPRDRRLAETTSWFGKPLDPKAFWKDKPVWLDTSAQVAAYRHGRLYPPIPFGEQKFASYSEQDVEEVSDGPDSGYDADYSNERERAYWSDFVPTHPRPPEDLEREQVEIESAILSSQNDKWIRQSDAKLLQSSLKDSAIRDKYPLEALTDDALHWAYVVHQKQQYQHDTQTMPLAVAQAVAKISGADLTQLTNSLSADQLKAANAWKIAYLQRLRREKVDEQYITAYMQAWKLSAEQVFNSTN